MKTSLTSTRLTRLALVAVVTAVVSPPALAGGAEFQSLYDLIHGWATGYLGKSLALAFLIVGLGVGVIRGSVMACGSCIAAAVCLLMVPGILDTMFAAGTV